MGGKNPQLYAIKYFMVICAFFDKLNGTVWFQFQILEFRIH